MQAAIDAAPTDSPSTIRICAGKYTERITIPKNLTLVGDGAGIAPATATILDGDAAGTVVTINTGVTVTLQDLTVTDGRSSAGGGINNKGTLRLVRVSVTGNAAPTTFGNGGGILNAGTLSLAGVSVTGNAADSLGGGIHNSRGTLTLEAGSSVTNNTANAGGGIYILKTPELNAIAQVVTLQADSTVAGNTTGNYGGGIANNGGTLILQAGSSVTGNKGSGGGGGIYNEGAGTTTLEAGSTVSNNTSIGTTQFSGGGIYNQRAR